MKKGIQLLSVALGVALLALVGTCQTVLADSIGPNCGSGNCLGNVYTLNYGQSAAQTGTDNYTITLTITSSGFVHGTDSGFLMAVSPDIPGSSNAKLTSAPGGVGDWSGTFPSGLGSGWCNGHDASLFCNFAESRGTFNAVGSSTPLVFTWTLTDSSLTAGKDPWGIEASFESKGNTSFGVTDAMFPKTSSTPSAVPEPATLGLVGIGLLGLALAARNRLQATARTLQ